MKEDRKSIIKLSNKEAEEIVKYCFPDSNLYFKGITHSEDIKPNEDGSFRVTMGGRLPVGIHYINDYPDNCILHFDNPKVVSWLYQHNYEVGDLLKENEDYIDIERWEEKFSYFAHQLSTNNEGKKSFETLEEVINYAKKLC